VLAIISGAQFDPKKYVVISSTVDDVRQNACGCDNIENLTAAEYRSNEIEVFVKAACQGYLVVLDSFYDGWSATVDHVLVPILKANYMFRAVRLSAGDHVARFSYAPFNSQVLIAAELVLTILAPVMVPSFNGVLSRMRRLSLFDRNRQPNRFLYRCPNVSGEESADAAITPCKSLLSGILVLPRETEQVL
jgi:hypothetical protein